jgi:hypothetical protein
MGFAKKHKAWMAVMLALVAVAVLAAVAGSAAGATGTISFAPSSVMAGSSAFDLTMTLTPTPAASPKWTVQWSGPGGPASLTGISVTGGVKATVGAGLVTVAGPAYVTVGDGTSTWYGTFMITPPAPVLSHITPATAANSSTSVAFALTGSGMQLAGNSSTVTLQSGATVVATATVTSRSTTEIDGTFDLASPTVAPGKYDVVVSGGGVSATLPAAFTVTGPTLSGIAFNYGTNTNPAQSFALTGTGLSGLTNPTVALMSGKTTVATATALTAAPNGQSMTGTFNLASPVVPAGVYDVVLAYSNVASVTLTKAFTVNNPIPTIASISPTTVYAGSAQPGLELTITGTGFVPAPTGGVGSLVQIGTRTVTDTEFVSSTTLKAALKPADIAAAATVPVKVVNPTPAGTTGGGSSGTVNLTVASDTTAPVTTITGADDLWHNTAVVLTVAATDAQSGVQKTQCTVGTAAAAVLNGSTITVPADGTVEGATTVTAWSVDWCGNTESPAASVTVNMDTVGPKTKATVPSSVKAGTVIKFGYKANDLTPKCKFTLKIRYKSTGKSARTYNMGLKGSNSDHSYKINPRLVKGTYTYSVYAKDQAGNAQSKLGQVTFKVK